MKGLLLLIPLVPLLASCAALVAPRRLAGWTTVCGCAFSLLGLLLLAGSRSALQALWLAPGGYELTLGLRLDGLALAAGLLVAGVSLPVLIYAVGYAKEEEGVRRFFAGMSFFVGAMLTLVLADSLLLLFVAWEWVGFASWLLIGLRYREEAAREAARRAFLVTRFGDVGFLIAWLLILYMTGSTNLEALFAAVELGLQEGYVTLLALLFLAAAVGKSAQLPLTAWLPPAMAGPTPVSALIHSATMVAAGVFLLLRLWPLYAASPAALQAILWIGGLTALLAALAATVQNDLKRVLAWSTASQLGEMMLALGLGAPLAAAWHLGSHAFFKSTLFLCAGAVERGGGGRDLRGMGGLGKRMPWTSAAFILGALALAGIPPFSGYWSEDAILAAALTGTTPVALLLLILIFLAGAYIARAGMAAFGRWPGMEAPDAGDPLPSMKWGMAALAAAAALGGWLLKSPLEHLLPFAKSGHAGFAWKAGAALAGAAGLLLGGWRVRRAGPVPAFGSWPDGLALLAEQLLLWPARGTAVLARWIEGCERGLDAMARGLYRSALLLAGGGDRLEKGFDQAGWATARSTVAFAAASQNAETEIFAQGGDNFARALGRSGGQLKRLQTGKIYLYNLAIFAWAVALFFVCLALWVAGL